MPFTCTICGEESTRICAWCTKDTCGNHLCEKCGRCSDCCECEVPLTAPVRGTPELRHKPLETEPEDEPAQLDHEPALESEEALPAEPEPVPEWEPLTDPAALPPESPVEPEVGEATTDNSPQEAPLES